MHRLDVELAPKRAEFSAQKTQFMTLISGLICLSEDKCIPMKTPILRTRSSRRSKRSKSSSRGFGAAMMGAEIAHKVAECKTEFPALTLALTHLFEAKGGNQGKRQR
eukprot:3904760-Rhodomonas_salina.5